MTVSIVAPVSQIIHYLEGRENVQLVERRQLVHLKRILTVLTYLIKTRLDHKIVIKVIHIEIRRQNLQLNNQIKKI